MKTVGAFEAKTHFNELLKRVSKGETIRIILRGTPVANLVPREDAEPKDLGGWFVKSVKSERERAWESYDPRANG